jgi:hypothetical protein
MVRRRFVGLFLRIIQHWLTPHTVKLIASPGSFGSTFWYNSNNNRAGFGSSEEKWSTAANQSTVNESEMNQDDN